MDKTDKAIIELLQQNAKLGMKEIASKIGLTITPTYERVKRLEKTGVIKGYQAIIDKALVGKGLQVHCHVSLKAHNAELIDLFEKEIVQLEEVEACYHVTGDEDYTLVVQVKDIDTYHTFLRGKLSAINNIAQVKSSFIMNVLKG